MLFVHPRRKISGKVWKGKDKEGNLTEKSKIVQAKTIEESDSRIKQMKSLRVPSRQFGRLGQVETVFWIFYGFILLHRIQIFLESLKVASSTLIFFPFF